MHKACLCGAPTCTLVWFMVYMTIQNMVRMRLANDVKEEEAIATALLIMQHCLHL